MDQRQKQLVQSLMKTNSGVRYIFNVFIKRVSPHIENYERLSNPATKQLLNKNIAKELKTFQNNLNYFIERSVERGWDLADKLNDEMVLDYIKGMGISEVTQAQMLTRSAEGAAKFLERKINGLGLSDRVWKVTNDTKTHLDFYLESGIASGRSAEKIGQDIKQLLKDPDKRFRRVRDPKTGKLKLSKPMEAYKPGRGVYRSPRQNALRLAITETSMAYRKADMDRWQKMQFVTGYEVKLSAQHPLTDICDSMVGKYPKGFIFTGWHPRCICFAVPILMPKKDFIRYLKGENVATRYIQQPPAGFYRYVESNRKAISGWKSQPYWVKDNFKSGHITKGLKIATSAPIPVSAPKVAKPAPKTTVKQETPKTGMAAYLSNIKGVISDTQVRNILSEFARLNPSLFDGGLDAIKISRSSKAMMSNSRAYRAGRRASTGNTLTLHNSDFRVPDGVFNPLKELKGAFTSIRNSEALTFKQEYALESLWHEIGHSRAKGWGSLYHKSGLKATNMEILNQFYARHTYDDFIKQFGGKASHKSKIWTDGYGYHGWLRNFRTVLSKYNISNSEVIQHFEGKLLKGNYEDLHFHLVEFLKDKGVKNAESITNGWRRSEDWFSVLL